MSVKRPLFVLTLTLGMVPGLFVSRAGVAAASSWQITPSPDLPGAELYGVTAISENNAWTVGRTDETEPLIEHWDGTVWSVSPTPTLPSNGWLFGVSANGPRDVWAVGRQTSPGDGEELTLAEHWNGSKWKVVPTPNPYSGSIQDADELYGVQALSSSDVWAVGDAESPTHKIYGLVERWDGSTWSTAPAPRGVTSSISLTSDSLGWVAGSFGPKPAARWNGTSWKPQPTPLGSNGWFYDVLTQSKTSAWAVGGQTTDQDPSDYPLIEQYRKGTGWTVVSPGTGDTGRLHAVSAGSADDMWAVGLDGSQPTASFLLHWDGSVWTVTSGPTVPGFVELESVVAVPSSQEFWAVGMSDDGQVIEHYA